MIDFPNTEPCEKVFAILSVDADGNEGILGLQGADGSPLAAVTSSQVILELMKNSTRIAMDQIHATGKTVVVAEFQRVKEKDQKL